MLVRIPTVAVAATMSTMTAVSYQWAYPSSAPNSAASAAAQVTIAAAALLRWTFGGTMSVNVDCCLLLPVLGIGLALPFVSADCVTRRVGHLTRRLRQFQGVLARRAGSPRSFAYQV